MKVNFIIIGAQKSGTSSLSHQLAQHPKICFCKVKEPHYFSRNKDCAKSINKYHKLFNPEKNQICGEASTSYTFSPINIDTPARLYEYNPEMKLIYIMRDPVERIKSHYIHRYAKGTGEKSSHKGILNNSHYVNVSRYGMQIENYLEIFPRENLLLLVFEEFLINHLKTLGEISDFLGITHEPFKNIDTRPKNSSSSRKYIKKFRGARYLKNNLNILPIFLRSYVEKRLYYNSPPKIDFSNLTERILWRSLKGEVEVVEHLIGRRLNIWRDKHEN